MRTLLITHKMSPELAARVQESVRGRRALPGARLAPRSIAFVRVLGLTTIALGAFALVLLRQRENLELERQRSALLEEVRRESSALGPHGKATVARARVWLERCAGSYAGDFVAPELRGELATALARPLLYVRGPLAGFRDWDGIHEHARSSYKDALALCLVDPPATRGEKALLGKARAAHSGGAREVTAHVERLHHALVGLPFLGPEWEARVARSEQHELALLERAYRRAPLAAARRAARAGSFLLVLDEPGDGPGPTELDGERAHFVRVALVDLHGDKLLLRLRRRVDPSGWSASARAEYATGLDSCALALDVHTSVAEGRLVGGG